MSKHLWLLFSIWHCMELLALTYVKATKKRQFHHICSLGWHIRYCTLTASSVCMAWSDTVQEGCCVLYVRSVLMNRAKIQLVRLYQGNGLPWASRTALIELPWHRSVGNSTGGMEHHSSKTYFLIWCFTNDGGIKHYLTCHFKGYHSSSNGLWSNECEGHSIWYHFHAHQTFQRPLVPFMETFTFVMFLHSFIQAQFFLIYPT